MGRMLRPRLPGVAFHITARTQGQAPLFAGAEKHVASLIRGAIRYSDAELVAYAVMANHIHVVVIQGKRPLGEFMQPLLRKIAMLVRRRTGHKGHVFQGRYAHRTCQDPEYFRSIIAYVHLNPVRAGLCRSANGYRWTSHRDYAHGPSPDASTRYALALEQAVRVFARRSEQTADRCRRDYRAYMRWRVAMDTYLADDPDIYRPVPRTPLSMGGDLHWHREYGSARPRSVAGLSVAGIRPIDLRDHVRVTLHDVDPDLPLEWLRSGGSTRLLVRVRNQVVARAISAGYSGRSLATFLNISPSSVSRVKARVREGTQL